MHRGMQIHKTVVRANTFVWMLFFGLLMAGLLVSWFVLMTEEFLSQPARDIVSPIANFVLTFYGMVITLWCAVKLRGLPKDLSTSISEAEPGP
jgi:glucan phosphoethanolaminetransferase (alkaline phosphatase superfamily)